jgi:hypothetical protein
MKFLNQYNNPFYIWWKVRKIFKFPKIHLYCGKITWFFGLPCRFDYYNRFIDIHTSGVGWKWKYDEPCFEWNPHIAITFFRKWQIIWVFTYYKKQALALNEATWEAMLGLIYRDKDLATVVKENTWSDGTTIHDNLTKWAKNSLLNKQ